MKDKQLVSKPQVEQIEEAPYLCWNFKRNEENGKLTLDSLKLSDDSVLIEKSFLHKRGECRKKTRIERTLSRNPGSLGPG